MSLPLITASDARRIWLGAQGLLDDPHRRADLAELRATVHRIGFVQVDTINVAGRAHDLTLRSRLEGYRPEHLKALLEDERALFEGWTHDASVIPAAWYAHWKPRFRRDQPRIEAHPWWRNLLGDDCSEVCAHVLARIWEEGPLGSADFDHPEKRGPWWGWKPQKAALDYLWRIGRLAISHRVNFHKRYDLPERVLPEAAALPEPEPDAHLEWACATAVERLKVFTPRELAGFWATVETAEARTWCQRAAAQGRIVAVAIENADGSAQPGYAVADWEWQLAPLPESPPGIRLLSPFDPVLRDRARALRRFGFDYRFEAFTPEPKRRYGYYVLPILEGDRLVGRLDSKLYRGERRLEVRGLWWEPGVRPTKARLRALEFALEGLAEFLGAVTVDHSHPR